jgi:DNA-binding NarL/FixJ family response regulator
MDMYRHCGASFETARARLELARSIFALGQTQNAAIQARQAWDELQQLGALPESRRAAALIGEIKSPIAPPQVNRADITALTTRELEVLRLIAAGKSNQEIATELVLSIRTVERHVSNIYQKLQISGPTARAVATAYLLRQG